jgi:tRNA1Val (adenine37-N6)-methyltransferase
VPNDYFQFKQFRIEQADCAQKVSTDACLLGAAADLSGATRILDIGTGTGLLALMAAQRTLGATIEAVELDSAAATQAAANVAASPWPGRVRVHAQSLAAYAAAGLAAPPGTALQFSHILCNPPFFQSSLLPPGAARAAARHATKASLTFAEIAAFAARFLQPLGRLAVLLPPPEMTHFEQAAHAAGLATLARLGVRHRPGGRLTRCIWEFGPAPAAPATERELVIQAPDGLGYSAEFRQLLAPFYLHL